MSWVENHKQIWRWVILVLLIFAIMGPWEFDQTNVPAEFACNPPHIRLEGDFCGLPISLIRIYSLVLILLILPIINTLFLLLRDDRPRLQKFHLVICGLNLGLVLLLGISNYPKFFYMLWGIWLYIGLMISILILEGIHFQMMRLKDSG